MPGFSSSGDDEVVHTEPPEHHVTARHKPRKQIEKVADSSSREGKLCTTEFLFFSLSISSFNM